jgi:hypothetical protein
METFRANVSASGPGTLVMPLLICVITAALLARACTPACASEEVAFAAQTSYIEALNSS